MKMMLRLLSILALTGAMFGCSKSDDDKKIDDAADKAKNSIDNAAEKAKDALKQNK